MPPLGTRVVATVVIPARDEAERVAAAVDALASQRALDGSPLEPATYEVVVFANGCRDATAARVREVAARRPFHTIAVLERHDARIDSVGAARRAVMSLAADRFLAARRPRAWIATTDADSRVDRDWLAATVAACDVDAVMGHVRADAGALAALPLAARRAYVLVMAYRRAVANAEATFDPVPWDPAPRHGNRFGASLAVRADAYVRAGGMPSLAFHEDLAFYRALVRGDARVRHALTVRVRTSMRADARVSGGYGDFVAGFRAAPDAVEDVEHPRETLQRIRARAALRHAYAMPHDEDARRAARAGFRCDDTRFEEFVLAHPTFGAALDAIEADARARGVYAEYARVPVAEALAALRRTLSAVRAPMRASVASGPG